MSGHLVTALDAWECFQRGKLLVNEFSKESTAKARDVGFGPIRGDEIVQDAQRVFFVGAAPGAPPQFRPDPPVASPAARP